MKRYRFMRPGAVLAPLVLCIFLTHAETPWHQSTLRSDGGGWVTGMVAHPKEKDLR
jgi:hypothetical protein